MRLVTSPLGLHFALCAIVGVTLPSPAWAQAPAADEASPPSVTAPPNAPAPAPEGPPETPPGAAEDSSPAPGPENETPSPAEAPQAPEAKTGAVVVLIFAENSGPLGAGVTVSSDDGASAVTSSDGAARLQVGVGEHELTATVPPELLAPGTTAEKQVSLGKVAVAANETTQVLVNIQPDGSVASIDVEGIAVEEVVEEQKEEKLEEVVVEYGTVSGQVFSSEEGTPVVGARVLVRGVDTEAVTDNEGRFVLEVPVGNQSVSVIHTRFSLQTVNDVVVEKDTDTDLQIELSPASTQLDDVVITAPHIEGGVASVLSERRKSSTVQDGLGSADIAKSPDGSASSATRRIVGASIVGGAFLFVRGLGGRYSNVRLNGVPMPSTDPDLPGFQLDLFPTSVLSGLTIAKTFSPDIPGDFAGGSLNVETRSFPEEFLLKLSLSSSYNSMTTFKDVLTYQGGETDWLGFDDGTRALPTGIPEERIAIRGRGNPDGFSPDEIAEFGATFPNNWELKTRNALPNLSAGLSIGDTIKTSAGDIGYYFTLGYKNRNSRLIERISALQLSDPETREVRVRETLRQETGSNDVQIGALGTVSYAPVKEHSFSIVSMLTQNGTDTTRLVTGNFEREGAYGERTQYNYVSRQLMFNQVLGKHREIGDMLDIAWQVNTARTQRDQPDSRNVFYAEQLGNLNFRGVTGSGEHLYTYLEQQDFGGGLDLTLALSEESNLKSGYLGRTGERTFAARRFGASDNNLPQEQRSLPPEELLTPEKSGDVWGVNETTLADDGFEASQSLHAVYGMLEFPLTDALRFAGGVRMERFRQEIGAVTPYVVAEEDDDDEEEERPSADRTDLDYLPGGTLIYGFSEDMSLRGAYGGTVARPQIREMAPFVSQDYVRRRAIRGNQDLKRTFIHNFDLRWELFPTPTEVFAVSLFYKLFQDPIESVIVNQNGDLRNENIKGANNYGAEFEARVGLGLISDSLESFSAMANLSLIQSQVTLSDEQRATATSAERPLAGQSPYVANLGAGYEPEDSGFSTYVYYNVFGRRIQDVGNLGLPDVYEEPFHSLDVTAFYKPDDHWSFGFTASNLMFQPVRVTQGGEVFSRGEPGLNLTLSAGWTY